MRIPRFAQEKRKVCNKKRSPPDSNLFEGQGTEHTTGKMAYILAQFLNRRHWANTVNLL